MNNLRFGFALLGDYRGNPNPVYGPLLPEVHAWSPIRFYTPRRQLMRKRTVSDPRRFALDNRQ